MRSTDVAMQMVDCLSSGNASNAQFFFINSLTPPIAHLPCAAEPGPHFGVRLFPAPRLLCPRWIRQKGRGKVE